MPTPQRRFDERRILEIEVGEEWRVGLAPTGAVFGGFLAAEIIRAGRQVLDAPTAALLSLSISYHRPILPGRLPLNVTINHRGGRIAALSVTVLPGNRAAATAQLTFGLGAQPQALPFCGPSRLPLPSEPAPGDLTAVVDWRALSDFWAGPGGAPLTAWIGAREDWRTEGRGLDPAWFAVAADLIGPALLHPALPGPALPREPFRVATVSLDLRVHATTESEWLLQRVTARRSGEVAIATVELSDPSGAIVATASQHALLLPAAPEELPISVTAFGWGIPDSSVHARMIGLN